MRRIVLLTVVALGLGACANASPGPGPGGGGSTGARVGTVDETRMDAYETVIRYLVGRERADWETIYVQDLICAKAGDAVEQQGCDGTFTAVERDDLVNRLSDLGAPIEFVHSYADADPRDRILEGKENSVFVRVGPIGAGAEGSLSVSGSMACGGLCGTGSIWKLEPAGEGFRVVGPVDGAGIWIA